MKCDVVIPVYNSPEWVKICIYSLFKNTDKKVLGKVILINDCSNEITTNLLNNLTKKYSNIEIINNEKNLGFVKSTNRGLKSSSSDYVLLLNTDCIVAKNTISKLINHIKNNSKIGLICPIASNAANLTLPLFDGFTYMEMDQLLERKFKGMSFDACTVVGNCLMITRKCLEKTGYLDEIYGMGYGEETDYQFKSMKNGFEAKVAIDTYVFHKAEVSFGKSKEKTAKQEKNREIFFSRWGEEYNDLMKEYVKNDPIKYIMSHLNNSDKKIKLDYAVYLVGIVQNAGGVHNVVDLINYSAINNISCNILYEIKDDYKEIMLFSPIHTSNLENIEIKKIVSTLYYTTYISKKIAEERNIPLVYYSQGYEVLFENGKNYGIAELSYKLADRILTISSDLQNKIKQNFNLESDKISNGINYDLLHNEKNRKKPHTITFVLRNNYLKGDFIALDIIKSIINNFNNIEINVLSNSNDLVLPFCTNNSIKINLIKGMLPRKEVVEILYKSDVYVDTSLTEGFGLLALEAMASGVIPIASNSGGINEYIIDGKNGYKIDKINDVDEYIKKIKIIFDNNEIYNKLKEEAIKTAAKFDYDDKIEELIKYFKFQKITKKDIKLTEDEHLLYSEILDKKFKISIDNKSKSFLYKICKKIPKKIRIKIKNKVEKLYQFTNER